MKLFFVVSLLSMLLLFPAVSLAAPKCVNDGTATTLCNPIEYSNDSVTEFAFKAVGIASSFFTLIGLMFVVFSGFRMIMSQGDSESLAAAKNSLLWSVLGLILGMFSFVIISATANYIGAKQPDVNSYTGNNRALNPLLSPDFGSLLITMLTGFLQVVGIITIFMIVLGGFRYITAAGNEEQAESGKKTLQWAVIGLIVVLLSYVIVRATLTFFGN